MSTFRHGFSLSYLTHLRIEPLKSRDGPSITLSSPASIGSQESYNANNFNNYNENCTTYHAPSPALKANGDRQGSKSDQPVRRGQGRPPEEVTPKSASHSLPASSRQRAPNPRKEILEKGKHYTLTRNAILDQLESSLDRECSVHDYLPNEQIKGIAYITESMQKLAQPAPRSRFEVGMVVDFVVIEPTTNGALKEEDDILIRTIYGTFLVKIRPGVIKELWANHCIILAITRRDGKTLNGLPRDKRLEYVAILNRGDKCTKATTPDDHWIQQSEHQALQIATLLGDSKPLKPGSYVQHSYGIPSWYTTLIVPRAMLDSRSIDDLQELSRRTRAMLNPVDPRHFRDSITQIMTRSLTSWGGVIKQGYAKTLDAVGEFSQRLTAAQDTRAKIDKTELPGKRTDLLTTNIDGVGGSALPQLAESVFSKRPKAKESISVDSLQNFTDLERYEMRSQRYSTKEDKTAVGNSPATPEPTYEQHLAEVETKAQAGADILSFVNAGMSVNRREKHANYIGARENPEISVDIKNRLKREYDDAFDEETATRDSERKMAEIYLDARRIKRHRGDHDFHGMVNDIRARFETLQRTSRLGDHVAGRGHSNPL